MSQQIITFKGTGRAFPMAWNSNIENGIRRDLIANSWGVHSVNVTSQAGYLSNWVNLTIKLTGPCPPNQSYETMRQAVQIIADSNLLEDVTIRFDRTDRECPATVIIDPEPVNGGTVYGGGGNPLPSGGYVYNAGNLATVTVNADDEEFDFDEWFEKYGMHVMGGAALLIVLMRR